MNRKKEEIKKTAACVQVQVFLPAHDKGKEETHMINSCAVDLDCPFIYSYFKDPYIS
jgi:hypothetical protein